MRFEPDLWTWRARGGPSTIPEAPTDRKCPFSSCLRIAIFLSEVMPLGQENISSSQVLDCVVSTGRCLHPLLRGTSAVINQPKSLAEGVVMPVENRCSFYIFLPDPSLVSVGPYLKSWLSCSFTFRINCKYVLARKCESIH